MRAMIAYNMQFKKKTCKSFNNIICDFGGCMHIAFFGWQHQLPKISGIKPLGLSASKVIVNLTREKKIVKRFRNVRVRIVNETLGLVESQRWGSVWLYRKRLDLDERCQWNAWKKIFIRQSIDDIIFCPLATKTEAHLRLSTMPSVSLAFVTLTFRKIVTIFYSTGSNFCR